MVATRRGERAVIWEITFPPSEVAVSTLGDNAALADAVISSGGDEGVIEEDGGDPILKCGSGEGGPVTTV